MHKRLFLLLITCSLCLFVTACGPSEEKVAQAQQKYAQLVELHNQVVEAHKDIADDSLDELLTEISEQMSGVEEYNLAEMKDEEIDILIQTMESLVVSYEDALTALSDIKEEEDAAVLVPIPISVTNNTDLAFTALKLYEKGNYDIHVNILEGMDPFGPLQTLAGLIVQKDVENTPWILVLEDENGAEYEFELPVEEYEESAEIALKIVYNSDSTGIDLTNEQ